MGPVSLCLWVLKCVELLYIECGTNITVPVKPV